MPEIQLNRVGLTYQPATGSLVLRSQSENDKKDGIEFVDNKGASTMLVTTDDNQLARATWSELGREASLQLFMHGYEAEEDLVAGITTTREMEVEDETGRKEKTSSKVLPNFVRVHGLNLGDFDKVRDFLQTSVNVSLDREDWDVRGGNFGKARVSKLKRCVVLDSFESEDGKHTMEIPLANVSQIAVPGKNEIEIQYTGSLSSGKDRFELSVVRLYIPPPSNGNDDEEPVEPSKEAAEALMEEWRMKMKQVSDLYDEGDEAALGLICNIDEMWCNFAAPRGKYRVDVYKDFFRMRGKTYDFKIPYSTITQMHLLDHPDFTAKFLTISLNVPVKSGQQRYPHLVVTIDDADGELDLLLSDEELAQRYPDSGFSSKLRGNMPEQIAKLLKVVSQRKVFVMPMTGFVAAKEEEGQDKKERCVRCSYKANAGFLFPMKHSMVFLHKPVLYIRYDAIGTVEFKRSSAEAKTFDVEVVLAEAPDAGSGLARTMEFGQISRKQFDVLNKFFANETKVTIKNSKSELANFFAARAGDGLAMGGGSKKGRAAAAEGARTILNFGPDDEDDEDEEDSDFDEAAKKKSKKKKDDGGSESSSSSGGSGSSSGSDDEEDSDMAEEVPMDADEIEGVVRAGGGDVQGKRKRQSFTEEDATTKKKKKKTTDDGKQQKKKRDPKAPKLARTAYTFFQDEKRPELTAGGVTDFIEMSKQIAALWKTQTDKSAYERLAAQDKERFLKEMASYVPSPGYEEKSPGPSPMKESKAKKDPNAPKGMRTAFNFYGDEQRPLLKAEGIKDFSEVNKRLGEMWKALPEQDKGKYHELARKDKERHAEDMKTYKPSGESTSAAAPKKKKSAAAAAAATTTTTASSSAGQAGKKKKAKAPAGGELPSSDSSSSSDDSSSEDE